MKRESYLDYAIGGLPTVVAGIILVCGIGAFIDWFLKSDFVGVILAVASIIAFTVFFILALGETWVINRDGIKKFLTRLKK